MDVLRERVAAYIRETPSGVAPTQLDASILDDFAHDTMTSDTNGTALEANNFVITYLAPTADAPNQFAISVQCQSYGYKCLRSYLLDYDGMIRVTAESRQATAKDPPTLDCEITLSDCKDVRWIVP